MPRDSLYFAIVLLAIFTSLSKSMAAILLSLRGFVWSSSSVNFFINALIAVLEISPPDAVPRCEEKKYFNCRGTGRLGFSIRI